MLGKVRTCRIDNHPAGIPAESPFDDWHGSPVKERQIGELLIHPEEHMVNGTEEFGNAILVDQILHPHGQFLGVAHLTGFIQHSNYEFLVIRCRHHGSIHVLFILFQLGQTRIALIVQFSHPREHFFDSR